MAFNKAKALQEAEKLVSQGKASQAIKQYLQILENEPFDLALLNTIGDLYVREKNLNAALKQFNKLAELYVQEGFTLKAIAIYKKVTKIDRTSVDPLLKLAELYTVQGLQREAREQFNLAVDFYKKRNQSDKALEILGKVVQLDPDNATHRVRYAEFCEQLGRRAEASQAYLESAEASFRRGDAAGSEQALKKATVLDAANPRLVLFRARVAFSKQQFDQVEKIIASAPGLKADAAARGVLLEAYLASGKLPEAEKLVLEVYRDNPADFGPLSSFSALSIEKGDYDGALKPLAEVADKLIKQKNTAPLMESLRAIWAKNPAHLPTLELIYRICERTADEFTLPEVLEALGHAYVQVGEMEKAETAFRKLIQREPENEHFKGLLKQVLQKQGKDFLPPTPTVVSGTEMALQPEAETRPAGADAALSDADQANMVQEILENSDLFSRYGLVEKAVAELEKVLAVYPDQMDIHQRILEICGRSLPARARQAAGALARIYTAQGDLENAQKYEQMARAAGTSAAEELSKTQTSQAPGSSPEFDLSAAFPSQAVPAASAPGAFSAPASEARSAEVAMPPGAVDSKLPEVSGDEFDLSGDFAALTGSATAGDGPAGEATAPAFNYEEARVEIDFYIEQGFSEEAEKAIRALEEKFPGDPKVAEIRARTKTGTGVPPVQPEPAEGIPRAPSRNTGSEELDWQETYGAPAQPSSAPELPIHAEENPGAEAPGIPVAQAEEAAAAADALGSLAGDLASSLEGIDALEPPPPKVGQAPAAAEASLKTDASSSLSGLLDDLAEPASAQTQQEDHETHYNLGVAFREMGLLDEAIGEFQTVVKGAQKGAYPPHFLQACSLLAVCFMEKNMPAIATKWYTRALEMPDLDEEATMALQYDMGVAYEQAGDAQTALEKYTEVYSQNIDYRDVAEKIRLLQQKA
jgi:tetratricopeptide (TPR) repeat protein